MWYQSGGDPWAEEQGLQPMAFDGGPLDLHENKAYLLVFAWQAPAGEVSKLYYRAR